MLWLIWSSPFSPAVKYDSISQSLLWKLLQLLFSPLKKKIKSHPTDTAQLCLLFRALVPCTRVSMVPLKQPNPSCTLLNCQQPPIGDMQSVVCWQSQLYAALKHVLCSVYLPPAVTFLGSTLLLFDSAVTPSWAVAAAIVLMLICTRRWMDRTTPFQNSSDPFLAEYILTFCVCQGSPHQNYRFLSLHQWCFWLWGTLL